MRSLPRYSYFADCKLYIRTRLLASAYSNFWQPPILFILSVKMRRCIRGIMRTRYFTGILCIIQWKFFSPSHNFACCLSS
ncbi:hypothetical protein EDD18DRAFT_1178860 [Armillaria luteobubalina]|uniref:Uncharacterized protein n=1 Tax=Armillaria luteobubalina TaxID=153913 RepID=A0AA39Q1M6_9AGAR|nr:hypothetical protein EDD18DRAFT_1178860 [Armillaria luteobubalina]